MPQLRQHCNGSLARLDLQVHYIYLEYKLLPDTGCHKWIRCIFIILHFWWYFSHNLDMALWEIEKCQLRDTSLNVHSPFARPHISTSNFGIFKDLIIMFLIALSNDNQWTVEWHTWLPYKTNQFHGHHDFLFWPKSPVLVRGWQNIFFVSAVKF